MRSFLTNSKMHPALAARIDASVRGQRAAQGEASSPRVRAVVRLLVVVLVASVIAWAYVSQKKESARVEGERSLLIDVVHGHNALLTDADRVAFASDAALVANFAGEYEGDLVSSELAAPGALSSTLARSSVYVHGPLDSYATAAKVDSAAVDSVKDTLLLCLVEPPAVRTEKAILPKVKAAYGGGAPLEQPTSNFVRLADASAALRILAPPWEAKVRGADAWTLGKLHAELDRTPVANGVRALKAGLLVVAFDEHAPVNGPAEIDGERPHPVRIAIVDLESAKVLLRVRRSVDPKDWSEGARTEYARGLDECAFAFDVRQAVGAR